MMGLVAMLAAAQAQPAVDLSRGPVATTTVAATVALDAIGRVVSCRAATPHACDGFPNGRVVSLPLRRDGKPVAGKMTLSTTTVVSAP